MTADDTTPTAWKVYIETAEAFSAASIRNGADIQQCLVAANQLYAAVVAAGAAISEDPDLFIEDMNAGALKRAADILAGRQDHGIVFRRDGQDA